MSLKYTIDVFSLGNLVHSFVIIFVIRCFYRHKVIMVSNQAAMNTILSMLKNLHKLMNGIYSESLLEGLGLSVSSSLFYILNVLGRKTQT